MRTFFRRSLGAAVALSLGLALAPSQPASAVPGATDSVFGVTASNKLVTFAQGAPATLKTSVAITGLASGENVVGIDFRPATGFLYAVTSASKVYTIDRSNGSATLRSTLATPLSGTAFGVDFNPVADRLRIVSDADQNLRVNVDTGATTVDGTLAYGGGTPNPSVVASAYTNPTGGATTTALFGIDSGTDNLVTQNPPNAGTLTAVGALTVDASTSVGLDITADGSALAAVTLQGGTTTGYYAINTGTGAATLLGTIGGTEVVHDIAVPLPTQARTFGLTSTNHIVTMEGPGVAHVSRNVAITGLQVAENILGIDVRPKTGTLYGLGSTGRLYKLDPSSGKATAVNATPFTPALSGTTFGFDFNPVADRVRIVSDTDQNLRVNPDTGEVAATDTPLAYAGTDADAAANPAIVGSAYTNSKAGAISTVLYGLDSGTDQVVTQDPPNSGTLNSIGTALGFDVTTDSGFDIDTAGNAYAVTTVSSTSTVYKVDLTAGTSTLVGTVPVAISDLAVADPQGYSFVASDGGIFTFGGARFNGSQGGEVLNKPVVGMATRAPGNGYWLVASDGGIFTHGDAAFHGSQGGGPLNKPAVGMAATPSGNGYWIVASDGGIFTHGDAEFFGSTGAQNLNAPIVGMAATKTGNGYWLFAADGGVFTFGDAGFYGSAGAIKLNKAVVGGAVAPSGLGYYLVASDGGVFNYGPGTEFKGSAGGAPINQPAVGIAAAPDGSGYWIVAADGGIFSYGSPFLGSTGDQKLNKPVVGMATS